MKTRYCANCQNPIEKYRGRNSKYCERCGKSTHHLPAHLREAKLKKVREVARIAARLKKVYGKVEVIGFNTKNSSITDAQCSQQVLD